jgi:hypothetical protein
MCKHLALNYRSSGNCECNYRQITGAQENVNVFSAKLQELMKLCMYLVLNYRGLERKLCIYLALTTEA